MTAQAMRTTRARTKKPLELVVARLIDPIAAPGTVRPPGGPPAHEYGNTTLSASSASARVKSASGRPRSRSAGSAPSAPTTSAPAAPMTAPRRIGTPWWTASWAAMNAPTPAKVAWHSDSSPPIPVMSVIERKMIEYTSPEAKVKVQSPGTQVRTDTTAASASARPPSRMTRSSSRLRVATMEGGGGGSQAERGSSRSFSERMRLRVTRRRARRRKGIAGSSPVCHTLEGAKYPEASPSITPRRIPPTKASRTSARSPSAAAASAATRRIA